MDNVFSLSLAEISGSTRCVEVPSTRLTFGSFSDLEPLWTPDGERVVFSSNREKTFDLYWTRADGTGTAERLTTGPQHEYPYAWSSDGGALVFNECSSSTLTGGCNVSLLPMEAERKPKVIVESEFNEVFPAVSADGRWVAYQSNESGRPEIFVRPFPAVDGGRWQASTGGGTEPLWGPSGRELFYRGPTALMMVPVETGAIPKLGTPQPLFNAGRYIPSNGRDYDISPKGDRFIFAAPITGDAGHIVVVENWFEELRRRVPTN